MKKTVIILVIMLSLIGLYFFVSYVPEETIELSPFDSPYILVETKESVELIKYEFDEFEELIKTDDDHYIPVQFLENQNVDIDLDLSTGIVTLVNREHLMRYKPDLETLEIDKEMTENNKSIIVKGEDVLVKSSLLEEYFDIQSRINQEHKVLLIKNDAFGALKGEVIVENYLYKEDNSESGLIKQLILEEEWILVAANGNWYFGYNDNMDFGYIEKNNVKKIGEINPVEKKVVENKRIFLTWDQIYSPGINGRDIELMTGVDIISPTWFKLIDDAGNFQSFLNEKYSQWARGEGYKIWPLVSNTFGDIEMTSRFLNNVKSREKFINELLIIYKKHDFQGINVDFENVYLKDRKKLTQFISELTYNFSKSEIIVSADVTILGGSETWSQSFNHERIGALVDYLMIMTYDEHWASSPISGSVASHNWVKSALEEMIKIVDKNKIVMGIPLFTRIWYEEPSRERVNSMDVSSITITMQGQENLLQKVGLKPIWDDEAKQFYLGYIEGSKVKKIWLEEEVSIKEKAKLVRELGISGVATWSRGLGTDNIWEVISEEVGD